MCVYVVCAIISSFIIKHTVKINNNNRLERNLINLIKHNHNDDKFESDKQERWVKQIPFLIKRVQFTWTRCFSFKHLLNIRFREIESVHIKPVQLNSYSKSIRPFWFIFVYLLWEMNSWKWEISRINIWLTDRASTKSEMIEYKHGCAYVFCTRISN